MSHLTPPPIATLWKAFLVTDNMLRACRGGQSDMPSDPVFAEHAHAVRVEPAVPQRAA